MEVGPVDETVETEDGVNITGVETTIRGGADDAIVTEEGSIGNVDVRPVPVVGAVIDTVDVTMMALLADREGGDSSLLSDDDEEDNDDGELTPVCNVVFSFSFSYDSSGY
mmetsp:Transcript_54681/g.70313  ORF Transcript_54681/g.70313 Transcript_54681/m.70313 type:complete len:110 (-) Transcript_54681:176-505(-)